MPGLASANRTASKSSKLDVGTFFQQRRDTLVDQAIDVAKKYGYARYTTTIRAAWNEAVDCLSQSLISYLSEPRSSETKPEAEVDYHADPRFEVMRDIARRHRSLGVTLQLYVGLLKHFRDIYLSAARHFPGSAQQCRQLHHRVSGFFDSVELSVGADWAESSEDERLRELQSRTRSLILEKDRYFSVFESLRDPAFLLDRDSKFINANQAAAEVFVGDASAGDIVYLRSMRTRTRPLEEVVKNAKSGRKQGHNSVWLETKSGPRCFDIQERAIHDALENTKLGYVVILHDVTPHLRATEEAQRAQRAMSNFLATMSHEIRTPLHSVLGGTALLRDADSDRQETYIDAIESAGLHLLQTLNKVLEYSKMEARPPAPTPQLWVLSAVFEEYRRFGSVWANQAKVPLTMTMANNLPACVLIDWAMTQQVLTNLVSNAIRHDSGKGVEVHLRRRSKGSAGPHLHFEVRDTGPGISADCMDTLFEPFGVLSPRASSSGGAGLGLAISKRLVEAMGGEIGFKNRSKGATFWFDVPYKVSRLPNNLKIPETQKNKANNGQRTGLKCLVVDDDLLGMMVTTDHLSRQGIDVTTAETGAEAIEAAKHTEFDAFVIDYFLADANGETLMRQLRKHAQKGKAARYVALTANPDIISASHSKSKSFDVVLAKPADGNMLAAAIFSKQALGGPGASKLAEKQSLANAGVAPRVVNAMVTAFVADWKQETEALYACLAAGDANGAANIAHKLASSCAVIGILDVASILRDLEQACRDNNKVPECSDWKAQYAPKLNNAPKQARTLAGVSG